MPSHRNCRNRRNYRCTVPTQAPAEGADGAVMLPRASEAPRSIQGRTGGGEQEQRGFEAPGSDRENEGRALYSREDNSDEAMGVSLGPVATGHILGVSFLSVTTAPNSSDLVSRLQSFFTHCLRACLMAYTRYFFD